MSASCSTPRRATGARAVTTTSNSRPVDVAGAGKLSSGPSSLLLLLLLEFGAATIRIISRSNSIAGIIPVECFAESSRVGPRKALHLNALEQNQLQSRDNITQVNYWPANESIALARGTGLRLIVVVVTYHSHQLSGRNCSPRCRARPQRGNFREMPMQTNSK